MTPHLRGQVRAYVDRALPGPILRVYDQHVVVCLACRAAADQERRIVASLRADTGVPQALRSSLLGLASLAPAERGPLAGLRADQPGVPVPPVGFRMPPSSVREPVPTVPPQSPALHRSPMRAAVVASLAAGASVAAAWSLAVTPIPVSTVARAPISRAPVGVASAGAAVIGPAGFGSRSDGGRTSETPSATSDALTRVVVQVRSSVSGAISEVAAELMADRDAPVSSVLVSGDRTLGHVRRTAMSSAQSGP